jgi:hypothetical protein
MKRSLDDSIIFLILIYMYFLGLVVVPNVYLALFMNDAPVVKRKVN